ncbi:phosphotransferase [Catenulispora pinisilvae]|uniref:phosphotransferase n=1 Tax=Catenulispora pinisilvae TaxID=2705253 RepID=UPI0018919A58|nr:phosphotransferase [Catenulispora pinisilvae]
MLNPPDAFSEDDLRLLLANNWGLTAARLEYVPVGFGSHHWSVRDSRGGRWFVNVDELAAFPLATDDPLRSLRNALSVPRALVDHGHRLTVAPERTGDGAVLAELGEQGFAVSVYRQLAGESFDWQPWDQTEATLTAEALAVVTELHRVPESAWGSPEVETFTIARRASLDAVLAGDRPDPAAGPYADRAAELVSQHAPTISAVLDHYDRLAETARGRPDRFVLTHGEPHLGNYMRAYGRLLLIDWDSALIGPPERDLWSFGLGEPRFRELYQLRWDLSETAVDLARFAARHTDGDNERATWTNLVDSLAALETTAANIGAPWTSRH